MSMAYGIQDQLLEVTVVACNKLKDTEWISRQDPYVCLEYGSSKYRTRTCTDGGKNPTFQEKFVFTLIEGLREINVVVWNSNTVNSDDFIGSGKVQLQKVLSQGFDDTAWPLQTKRGRHAGEVRLIMHYANANISKPATSHAQSGSPYVTPTPGSYPYSAAPPHAASHPPPSGYPAPSPYSTAPPPSAYYPASPYPTVPPPSAAYNPASPYPPQSAAYPSPYSSASAYPPQPYPPQGYSYPPGSYPGAYPPRSH